MRGVLLMACAGPMQSWGTRSRFQERDTEREPTKSGVVGMLCAALGRDRSEPVGDLTALKMGVRVDREGVLRKDFQTAKDVIVASGKSWEDLISSRYYLADAAFLVGLEGDLATLRLLHAALAKPRWHLFLGRKSYLPSIPPFLGDGLLEGADLESALRSYPLLVPEGRTSVQEKGTASGGNYLRLRLVVESYSPTSESRKDQPVSFAEGGRVFHDRYLETSFINIESSNDAGGAACSSPS